MYDFDSGIERRGTASVKWDCPEYCYPGAGAEGPLLPLWVADMDFAVPPALSQAVQARARHPVYGYTELGEGFEAAFIAWMRGRHGLAPAPGTVHFSPGVVTGLALCVNAFTQAGDGIIIQPPVYHPFRQIIASNGRRVVENPLVLTDSCWEMDLEGLEALARAGAKALVLCSPHNPVGRVWREDEMEAVARIASDHGLFLISDEIHSDLVLGERRHLPALAWAGGALGERLALLHAPSKTFNMAGLQTSAVAIPGAEAGRRFEAEAGRLGLHNPNAFGAGAAIAAWESGGPWLDALLSHLGANADWLARELPRAVPGLALRRPEATFLAWIDARRAMEGAGIKDKLGETIARRSRLWLDDGAKFGTGGSGWLRLNFGCPRSTLEEALGLLRKALA